MFDGLNKWLDGKKTIIAGIAGALTALGAGVASLQDGFQMADLVVMGAAVTATAAIFGFGGKLQKLTDALKALK